jgi:hypothetical protein
MEDLSYLTTEYARNKDIECYNLEAKERDLDKDRAADINKLIEDVTC